jgi:tRNA A37 N6-isopentenylltransferase MiaA
MSRWLFFPSFTSPSDGEFTYCQLANSQIQAWRPPILVGGTFLYCQLANSQIEAWRPPILVGGTFLYCAQDINQFNRTP